MKLPFRKESVPAPNHLVNAIRAAHAGPSVRLDDHRVTGVAEPRRGNAEDENAAMHRLDYDPESASVRLPEVPDSRIEAMFRGRDPHALERKHLEELGVAISHDGSRLAAAERLARSGQLRPDEIAHLRWLATAAGAVDEVHTGTPITVEQARRIVVDILDQGEGDGSVTRVTAGPSAAAKPIREGWGS